MTTPSRKEAPTTWPELIDSLSEGRDVYATTMEVLRDIEGAGRTGKELNVVVEARLVDFGLGHLPETLPARKDGVVILYRKGTRFAEIVRALQGGITSGNVDQIVGVGRRVNGMDSRKVVPMDRTSLDEAAEAAARVLDILGGGDTSP